MLGRASPQLARGVVDRRQLYAVAVGLLEVVAENLLVFDAPASCRLLQPGCKSLVQLRAQFLWHAVVRGVANQQVTEPEGVLAWKSGSVRTDELLANEGLEMTSNVSSCLGGGELDHSAAMEHLALHRGPFDDRSLVRAQAVEPCCKKGLNRRRDGHRLEVACGHPIAVRTLQEPVVDEHGEHLLDEQRVALGCIGDPSPHVLGEARSAQKVEHELSRILVAESFEQDRGRVELATAPAGPVVEKLWASEADEQDGCVARPVGYVFEEIEEGRLAPLKVVEDEDEGLFACLRLEQLAHGPEGLLGGASTLGEPDRCSHASCDQLRVLVAGQACCDRRNELLAVELSQDLEQRPEGDSFAVGQAAPTHHGCVVAEPLQELRKQS
jgi:hypothetical protein